MGIRDDFYRARIHYKANLLCNSAKVEKYCINVIQSLCYHDYVISKPKVSDVLAIDKSILIQNLTGVFQCADKKLR